MKKILLLIFIINLNCSLTTCDSEGADYFKFLSKTFLKISNGEKKSSGKCFKELLIKFIEKEDNFEIEITAKNKISYFCLEFLTVTSGKSTISKLIFFPGKKIFKFPKNKISVLESNFIKTKGFKIMKSCSTSSNWLKSIYLTLKLFWGLFFKNSKLPKSQENANIEMIEHIAGYKWKRRTETKYIKYPKELLKNGDLLLATRFDGISNIIHIGAGSRVGHCAMVLKRNNEVYVCESENNKYSEKKGVHCMTYDDFTNFHHDIGFNMIVLHLKEEKRKIFNVKKVWEFMDDMWGTPYGDRNFIFGWLDTPEKNLPDFLDLDFLLILLDKIYSIIPSAIDNFFLQAFNKRLNTENLKIKEIYEELYKKNLSIGDLVSIVEKENWVYKGTGHNYVCSAFVAALYKKAGLFGNLEIEATEFTPKDIYELDFYEMKDDLSFCEGFVIGGYCQIMGDIYLDLGKHNFVEAYSGMNESCPSVIPDFKRTKGC